MVKIYGINDEEVFVEEDGDERIIPSEHCDIRFFMTDGTIFVFKYSIKKNKIWTAEVEEEGFEEYEHEEYDNEYSEYPSDTIEIDSSLEDYELI